MLDSLRKGRWLIAASLVAASCAQGDRPKLIGPTGSSTTAALDEGNAGILAEGDVKVGNGSLVIERLRMDRQNGAGVSILRQYANPGGEYRMEAGETIELWAEYPAGVPRNPRLIVDWGDGLSDITNCGRCLLTHTYPNRGRYVVKVTLDDLTGTTITRTFVLNSLNASCTPPTVNSIPDALSCSASSLPVGGYFGGTNLTYSLQDGVCVASREFAALRTCTVTIDPATGVITGDLNCTTFCRKVTATNACGTVTSNAFFFGCT